MSTELARIQERLASEGEKTLAFFETLSSHEWDQQVYTTGSQWRVRQFLAHFVSAERAYMRFMRDVLQGGQGAPRDFDINAFNEAETPTLSRTPVPELMAAFRQVQAELIELSKSLTETDLSRVGYHPWFGEMELSWYLKLVYRHNMIHLRDIRQALQTGQPVPHAAVLPPTQPG